MTVEIKNQQKYENYREQFRRLNQALNSGFNLEAIFIEYAIMEDRTESILRHAALWEAYVKSRKGHEPALATKIGYIQKAAENKKSVLHKFFSDELLSEILHWKDERNRLIHALLKQQLAHNEVSDLAMQGNALVKRLRARSGDFTRAMDRRIAKAGSHI